MILSIILFSHVSIIYGVNIVSSPSALSFQDLMLHIHELLTQLAVREVCIILDL